MSLAAFTFTDRARPLVQIAVGDDRYPIAGGRWDVAKWDAAAALWSGGEWLDVTCETFAYECEYGRARSVDRFVPGTATVLVDNASGWADPFDTSPGIAEMRPGRRIRLGLWHAAYGTRWLFHGYIDAITPTYSPTDPDRVQLSCVDALGEVNRAKFVPTNPAWTGETATDRIHRILSNAHWPDDLRDIAASADTLIATDLGGQAADLLGVAADSVGGAVFGDHEGRIAFRPRDWQTYAPGTPLDGTIGNVVPSIPGYWTDPIPAQPGYLVPTVTTGGTTTAIDSATGRTWTVDNADALAHRTVYVPPQWVQPVPGDICPVEWKRPFDRADIATRAIYGRDLATAIVADDPAGQQLYGIEPFERTDLLTQNDWLLTQLAQRALVTRGAATAPRVRAVTLDGRTSMEALDLMTLTDVYKPSRYRCRLQLSRGLVFDQEMFATGVAYHVDPSSFTLEMNLDSATPYASTGGRWDAVGWDRSLWGNVVTLLAAIERLETVA